MKENEIGYNKLIFTYYNKQIAYTGFECDSFIYSRLLSVCLCRVSNEVTFMKLTIHQIA